MSKEFESDYISIVDEEGNDYTLELLDVIEHKGEWFAICVTEVEDENDPNYGWIVLQIEEEAGEEFYRTVEDDVAEEVLEKFEEMLYEEDEE